MSPKVARVNYPDLDLAKLAMALLVVEIHTRPFRDVPLAEHIVEGIDVLAVPFFFVASAFLCFGGLTGGDFVSADSRGSLRVRKTAAKLLRLYLTWTVVFLPVTLFGDMLYGRGLLASVVSFAQGTLFIGENFCSWPLWYLLAGVVAFGLVYLLLRGGSLQGGCWPFRHAVFWWGMHWRRFAHGTAPLRRSPFPLRLTSPFSPPRETGCSRGSSMSRLAQCSG